MEETLFDITKILIPGIILSIFTAIITVRLSLRRFSYERLWERKLDSYTAIFEALHKLKNYYQIKRDIDIGERSYKKEKAAQIEQQWATNNMEVNKAIDIGSLVISQDSIDCLKDYRSKPRMDPEDNPIFELASTEIKYLDDCINKLNPIAIILLPMRKIYWIWHEIKRRNVLRRNSVYAAVVFIMLKFRCWLGNCLFAILCVFGLAGCCQSAAQEKECITNSDERQWTLIFEEDFKDESYKQSWRLEGTADLNIVQEDETTYLHMLTKKLQKTHHSVLWYNQRLEGDLRFVFRARGQKENGTIFYFNARTPPGSAYKSIFDWERPDAVERRYSRSKDYEAYTLGYLRAPECVLRHVGGVTSAAWPSPWNQENTQRYARESIILEYPSPYGEDCDKWHMFDVRVVGQQVTVDVDGKRVAKFEDQGKTPEGSLSWIPLTGGGWTGLRNFRVSWVDVDFFKVYCAKTVDAK